MKRGRLFGVLVLAGCLLGALPPSAGASAGGATAQRGRSQRLTVTGTVVGIGGRFAGRSRPFTLTVNSYTPPGEVERLNEALRSGCAPSRT
jgi:hypothetical protein